MLIIAATETAEAPHEPNILSIISAATLIPPATSEGLRTWKYATFATIYMPITASVPPINDLGKFFCGSVISHDTMLTLFQPSYAPSPPTSPAIQPQKTPAPPPP